MTRGTLISTPESKKDDDFMVQLEYILKIHLIEIY